MTQDYYGTKRVTAWPQNKNPTLIASPEGYAVMYEGGYTSWSPKDVFDAAYQPITAMGFGHAIAALKEGGRVARAGWNGKGMFIWLRSGSIASGTPKDAGGVSSRHFEESDHGTVTEMPCICMLAADGSIVVGWLASQTDMLAEDWMIVE
jgi:hypothetical protein